MTHENMITIGQRWFQTIKKDYADWRFAWAREAGQNSLDAGATAIHITVTQTSDFDTKIVWADNGCGMGRETLESKFMAIGGSEKPDGGTGGFGVAKLILAFAQKSYSIRSQDIKASGEGAGYSIEEGLPYHNGLILTAIMEGDEIGRMERKIRDWVRFTTTKCEIFLNGEKLTTLRMHKPKLSTDWCSVYTHKAIDDELDYMYDYYIRVRINRQYMFNIYTSVSAHITVDLNGSDSQEYLTSNRDGMNYSWRHKLQKLVEELYENPNKIKRGHQKIAVYEGTDGRLAFSEKQQKKTKLSLNPTACYARGLKHDSSIDGYKPTIKQQSFPTTGYMTKQSFSEIKELIDGYDLAVSNSTTKDIPSKWIPGSMNKTATKLMNRWIRVLQTVGAILGRTEEIRPGWTFDSDARASYQYHPDHGHLVLLNPVTITATKFKNYWKNDLGSFYEMVAVAVHELTHIDQSNHNNGFARDITYSMGKVLAQWTILDIIRKETA